METDPTPEFDYLQASLEELEPYLLSDELFWPVTERPSSGGMFLKLTLGNVLLSLRKLEALHLGGKLSRAEESELTRMKTALEVVERKWQVAWERKAGWEFQSRFGQWTHILNDLKKDFERQSPFYGSEVRLRVLLELLKPYARNTEGYDLEALDAFLRGIFFRGSFIWSAELELGFPEDAYWFLYGGLGE